MISYNQFKIINRCTLINLTITTYASRGGMRCEEMDVRFPICEAIQVPNLTFVPKKAYGVVDGVLLF